MIIRTYKCDDCGVVFEVDIFDINAADPPCPQCEQVLDWVPGMFAIGTNKGKAVDVTQKILEEDYGLTNFNDNSREGDIAAKLPVETRADREQKEQMTREVEEMRVQHLKGQAADPALQKAAAGFWGGGGGNLPPMMAQTLLASAKALPKMSSDPIKILHQGAKSGQLPTGFRVI